MSKLIESTTTETLPSGTTITTLHLTPEAKRGLSTGGARIQAPDPERIQALRARFGITTPMPPPYDGSTAIVQRAVAEVERKSRRTAILCSIPVAVVGAALYLLGAPGLAIVAAQWVTGFGAYQIWKWRRDR